MNRVVKDLRKDPYEQFVYNVGKKLQKNQLSSNFTLPPVCCWDNQTEKQHKDDSG